MPSPKHMPHGPLCFAVVPPGFEAVLAAELKACGFGHIQREVGGVSFRGDPIIANRMLSCATRILIRVGRFSAPSFPAFEKGFRALDLSAYGGVTAQASSRKSKLYHTGALEERVSTWCDAGPTTLLIRLNKDKCTVSVDASGERLHRRGWRLENGPAPMRETLAACLLRTAHWTPGEALYDPMCGSGTFLIEAAVRASGLLPGRLRTFACERWLTSKTEIVCPSGTETLIAGSDRSAASVAASQANATRAGIELTVKVSEASEAEAPADTGLVIVNPPYGKRARDIGAYEALGHMLSSQFKHWRSAIVISSPHAMKALGGTPENVVDFNNGGIKLKFGLFGPRGGR